jgi:hypothetical protein
MGTILAEKISQDLKLHLDLPGVWWNLHLSDDGVFKSGDRVLELKNDHDFVYVFLKFIRSGRSLVCHPKKGRRSRRCVLISLGSPGGQRNVRMGHYIVQEHIYDKLIQQLYVAGRSDFLHLNPTSEEIIPFLHPRKLRIHRHGKDRVEFYNSLPTEKL